MTKLLAECREAGNIILMIDEVGALGGRERVWLYCMAPHVAGPASALASKPRRLPPTRLAQVHTLVGAGAVGRGGGGGGGMDISNLLKPALARGELVCIGATTLDEHRRHIERDAALER